MSLNEKNWAIAERLASKDYDVETFRDTLTNGDVVFLAKNPELPGCMAHGATLNEAIENLKEARTEYIYTLLEDGLSVPYSKGATTTVVPPDRIEYEQREVIGFGAKLDQVFQPDTREKDISFSFRGDFVK